MESAGKQALKLHISNVLAAVPVIGSSGEVVFTYGSIEFDRVWIQVDNSSLRVHYGS